MTDYDLTRLGSREFEHLTQALALRFVSPGMSVFGDGPDGGREATSRGPTQFPTLSASWNGYIVLQSKFKTSLSDDRRLDGRWLLEQIKGELAKFRDPARQLEKPEYYLVATNIALTAVAKRGGKDLVATYLKSLVDAGEIRDFRIWDHAQLCRLIDNSTEIRTTYAAFLLAGDVLAALVQQAGGLSQDFGGTISRYLQSELRAAQYVRLGQAGDVSDRKLLLANVFVDLPVAPNPEPDVLQAFGTRPGGIVSELIANGERVLRRNRQDRDDEAPESFERQTAKSKVSMRLGRHVLVGGPGQGKSTVGQFLCQIYRAALLETGLSRVADDIPEMLTQLDEQRSASALSQVTFRRFPIQIELQSFAAELALGSVRTVLEYVALHIENFTAVRLSSEELRTWLQHTPWLVVLDGLDEVPASSNREQVVRALQDFSTDIASVNADVLILATTRPQGYSQEFSPGLYRHSYLAPLSKDRALQYADRLVRARFRDDPNLSKRVMASLRTACEEQATARLMQTPLQITIMTTLVEHAGPPPRDRWRLFDRYYDVLYRRETSRGLAASKVLQSHESDIDVIHRWAGLSLQIESEAAGGTRASLTKARFDDLVRLRLRKQGYPDSAVEETARAIVEAALERLVFLVGLEDGKIGFEIRSLQEFMASEALVDGSDEQVRQRLERIAPASHWRNVILFAAGKCFAEKEHLRDFIHGVCAKMNTRSQSRLLASALAGSRLALDLLDEGIAPPAYAEMLLDTALKLSDFPDRAVTARLAASYQPEWDEKFRRTLEDGVRRPHLERAFGSWQLLLALMERDVSWTYTLAEAEWPASPQEATSLSDVLSEQRIGQWLVERTIATLPAVPPRIGRRSRQSRIGEAIGSKSPAWVRAVYSIQKDIEDAESLEVLLRDQGVVLAAAFIQGISGKRNERLKGLEEMPDPSPAWIPFVAAAHFVKAPNANALGEALRQISSMWTNDVLRLTRYDLPWPISACLSPEVHADQLLELADAASRGELGDIPDWLKAEERWRNEGTGLHDWVSSARVWPFGADVAEVGFPFGAAYLRASEPEKLATFARNRFSEPGGRLAPCAADIVLDHLEGGAGLGTGSTPITATEMRALVKARPNQSLALEALEGLTAVASPLSKDWIDFLDWLGTYLRVMEIGNRSLSRVTEIGQAYVQSPELGGLLRILGSCSLAGARISNIPLPPMGTSEVSLEDRLQALFVRAGRGDWDANGGEELAREIAELARPYWTVVDLTLRLLDKQQLDNEVRVNIVLPLCDALAAKAKQEWPVAVRYLLKLAQTYTSGLQEKTLRRDLGLVV
jgi:hypothetical protein